VTTTAADGQLGISGDHLALHEAARAFLQGRCAPPVPRAYLDDADDHLPPFWSDMVELGWFGIHLPEQLGGGGAGLAELAVVLEELGRVAAPGPFLPTVLAAAVIDRLGHGTQREALLPGLAAGTPAAVAFGPGTIPGDLRPAMNAPATGLTGARAPGTGTADVASADPATEHAGAGAPGTGLTGTADPASADPATGLTGTVSAGTATAATEHAGTTSLGDGGAGDGGAGDDGRLTLNGAWPLVLGAGLAELLVLPARRADGTSTWCVLDRDQVVVTPRPSVDATRRVADVSAENVTVDAARVLEVDDDTAVERLALRLLAAEAVGVAGWCVGTAAAHAQVREQFGRPIGQFQAVKHRCADMLCATELARAAAWDAVRGDADDPVADAAAAALAPEAALRAAEGCIQVLGGMGFTWEHEAHLYLKRALSLRSLAGPPARWRAAAVDHARAGRRRQLSVDLPREADAHRDTVRAFVAELQDRPKDGWRAGLADAGYLAPHWPRPWGRSAGALEQLVIDDEMGAAGVHRPNLGIAAWVLAPVIAQGTDEQQRRLVGPTLRGEISWCQLFSEPGAGSDLASLTTKASRTDGGWLISGQKVWTTFAHQTDLGLCLARTGEGQGGDKHDGITCFVVDMRSEGVDVRPLRELTGVAMFNEVFLTDVFVADENVVGAVGDGWRSARTTLGNERVSMSRGSSFGLGEEALLGLLGSDADADADTDAVAVDEVGRLLVEAQALAMMGLRMTLRAVEHAVSSTAATADPGPEASVRKLLAAEHDQKVQEMGWSLLGRAGAATDGPAQRWIGGYLANRCLTIAGGTSEIQRNVIAERLLGLPRDA
jgi:alkylation response protein AidB-like acyl-CoA dehydrogenase